MAQSIMEPPFIIMQNKPPQPILGQVWSCSNWGIYQLQNSLKFFISDDYETLKSDRLIIDSEDLSKFSLVELTSSDQPKVQVGGSKFIRTFFNSPDSEMPTDSYHYWWRLEVQPFK